jgi:hypothetical protein
LILAVGFQAGIENAWSTMQRYWERVVGRAESRGPELGDQVRTADRGDGRTRTPTL